MSASASLRESFPSSRTCREAHLCRNTPGLVLPGQGSHGHAHSRCIRSDMMDRRENNLLLASPPHCYLGISTELNSTGGNTGILFADENPWNEILFKEQISGKTNSPQERDRLLVILRHLGSGFRNGLDIKSSAYLINPPGGGSCEKAPACSRSFFLAHRRILIRL